MWVSSTANALSRLSISISPLVAASKLSTTRCLSSAAVVEGLKYSNTHEWVKHDGSQATIGITDHAQDHLGEVVFVELPDAGKMVTQGSSFGTVESVKAASGVNSPISGEVVEVNNKLSEAPGLEKLSLSGSSRRTFKSMCNGGFSPLGKSRHVT